MDKYETLGVVGEGSYGVVMKCRHRETGQLVAIKRFLETEEDFDVRKMVFREIRMLKKLRHENLVNMIEVFRRRKRFYLVFEYLDHTLLDELESVKGGLGWEVSKRHIFQVLRGLNFCHSNHIMHRDIKPENILVSPNGIVKLCDFGFARLISAANESCTDYVATRWYRAPELLVGDPRYGKEVDVWAMGCLFAELVTGNPLFPGESDVDQLHRITMVLGGLCTKHHSFVSRAIPGRMLRLASADELVGPPQSGIVSIRKLFPAWDSYAIDFLAQCLRMDPELRPSCPILMQHSFFEHNGFVETFEAELRKWVANEFAENSLITKKIEEERTLNLLSVKSPAKTVHKHHSRWRLTYLTDKWTPEKTTEETSEDKIQSPATNLITRPRKICYFDPVSIAPKTTYIRRLEHQGLVVTAPKGCTLPSLTCKRSSNTKANGKRKRIDFSNTSR